MILFFARKHDFFGFFFSARKREKKVGVFFRLFWCFVGAFGGCFCRNQLAIAKRKPEEMGL